jgi:hypothetical protein
MAKQQKRWICHECDREWAHVEQVLVNGQPASWTQDYCPMCLSEKIERVTYTPLFPGADYRSPPVPVQPLAEVLPFDRKQVAQVRNETLLDEDQYADQLGALLGVTL